MSLPPDEAAIRAWIALLDAAETAMATASPHDRTAMARVGQLLDQLVAQEHLLASSDRALARFIPHQPQGSIAPDLPRRLWSPSLPGLLDCGRNCTAPAYRFPRAGLPQPVPLVSSSIPKCPGCLTMRAIKEVVSEPDAIETIGFCLLSDGAN